MPRAFKGQEVMCHLVGGMKISLVDLEQKTKLSRSCIRHTVTKLQEMGLVSLEEKDSRLAPIMVKMQDGVQPENSGVKLAGVFRGNVGCLSRTTREALCESQIAGSLAVMHRLCGSNMNSQFDLV